MSHTIATLSRNGTVKFGQIAPIYIYALTDPDGVPRYVGKSADLIQRFARHLSTGAEPAIRAWVSELRQIGELPRLITLFRVPDGECPFQEEASIIRMLRATGTPLLNKLPRKRGRELPGDGIKRCTVCNATGHNRQTCPKRRPRS
jgi:hypothetical protein